LAEKGLPAAGVGAPGLTISSEVKPGLIPSGDDPIVWGLQQEETGFSR